MHSPIIVRTILNFDLISLALYIVQPEIIINALCTASELYHCRVYSV